MGWYAAKNPPRGSRSRLKTFFVPPHSSSPPAQTSPAAESMARRRRRRNSISRVHADLYIHIPRTIIILQCLYVL